MTPPVSKASGPRAFYLKHGYTLAARIPDFWADGDDKVVFTKRLGAT